MSLFFFICAIFYGLFTAVFLADRAWGWVLVSSGIFVGCLLKAI